MLRAFHIETGSGTVNAVRISYRHDRGGRIRRSQVRAAIGNAMARLHILDRAELRLQCHGRRQIIRARRAHGRISLITIQANTRAGKLKMNLRARKRGRRIGKMTNLRRNAGNFHATGEILEILDLPISGRHEFRHVGSVGHRQVTPLSNNMQHTLLSERHQLGERRVERGRSESITSETGIDLHVHTRGFPKTTRRGRNAVNARQ